MLELYVGQHPRATAADLIELGCTIADGSALDEREADLSLWAEELTASDRAAYQHGYGHQQHANLGPVPGPTHSQVPANPLTQHMCNMCTCNEVVNGAMGTVTGYDWPGGERQDGQQPCGIKVHFDKPRVGIVTRATADHLPTIIRPATFSLTAGMAGTTLSDISSLWS